LGKLAVLMNRILYSMRFIKRVLERILQFEASLAIRWVSSAHKRLMMVQWRLPPEPEHFDHQIDLFHAWLASRNSLWLERGAFNSLTLLEGDLLELGFGDGFNARNFYSLRSKRIIACDFDPSAIETARKKNSAPNIEYVLADIRTEMPDGKFENIVWDAGPEHFTQSEIKQILRNIKRRLTSGGILSGYTIVERPGGCKSLSHHEYEFKSKVDLMRLLRPFFRHVTVFETIYPERHNLYFWASDGMLPFRSDWPRIVDEMAYDSKQ